MPGYSTHFPLETSFVSGLAGCYPGNEFLRIKRFDNIVVRTKFQAKHLVKDLSLSGEHDDRYVGSGTDFPADLISVYSRQHQIQQNQIRLIRVESPKCLLPVIDHLCIETFFCQVQTQKLRDIFIIVYD